MAKEKEPKITISKEAALQITSKEECEKLLTEVRNAKYRSENIIKRRKDEIERFGTIIINLEKRLEFLSIVGEVEPNTWYDERTDRQLKNKCFVLSKDGNQILGWKFSKEPNTIRRNYRHTNPVFLHPLDDTIIVDVPRNKDEEVVVEENIEVNFQTYDLKGEKSFLLHWIPSSDLSQAVQNPSILEVKGVLDDMWTKNKIRSIRKDDNDYPHKGSLSLVKHNKQWYLLVNLD